MLSLFFREPEIPQAPFSYLWKLHTCFLVLFANAVMFASSHPPLLAQDFKSLLKCLSLEMQGGWCLNCYFFSPVCFFPCITTSPASLPGRPCSILALGWGEILFEPLDFYLSQGENNALTSFRLPADWMESCTGFYSFIQFDYSFIEFDFGEKNKSPCPQKGQFPGISHHWHTGFRHGLVQHLIAWET